MKTEEVPRRCFDFLALRERNDIMYKLLFAEDEIAAMKGILASIDWSALGIGPVLTARNGMAAWEIAKNDRPDILLTDIRMPRMNGIELAQRVRELNPQCSILILSGYSDPEYLRSAIKLKAVDFVDKPLKLEILTEQLRNAVAEQEKNDRRIRHIQQNISNTFVEKRNAAFRISELMQEAGFSIAPEDYCCAFLIQLVPTADEVLGQYTDADEFYAELRRMLDNDGVPYSGMTVGEYILKLQLYLSDKDDNGEYPYRMYERMSRLWNERYAKNSPLMFYVCASPVQPLSNHYEAAVQADLLQNDIFFYQNVPFHYRDTMLCAKTVQDFPSVRYLLQELEDYVLNQNVPAVQGTLSRLTTEMKQQPGITKLSVIRNYSQILNSRGKEKYWTERTDDETYLELLKCHTIEEVSKCFLNFIGVSKKPTAKHSITEEVLNVIRKQYSNCTLSLNDICQQIHRSPSYVCVRFHEDTGKTLTQYIHEYRIESSLPLLADSGNKINSIAEAVGFDNGNYYAKIFMRIKKMTPSEYRRSLHID